MGPPVRAGGPVQRTPSEVYGGNDGLAFELAHARRKLRGQPDRKKVLT